MAGNLGQIKLTNPKSDVIIVTGCDILLLNARKKNMEKHKQSTHH